MMKAHWAICAAALLVVAGCARFKPVVQDDRYFVLTPVAVAGANTATGPAVGLGAVVIPGYLLQSGIVVRRGDNEIEYSENLRWAERLDKNIQRVLAADLAATLGSNVFATAWRRDEVAAELHVTLNRFELDQNGAAIVDAKWLILKPGSDETVRAGQTRITRPGPPLSTDPDEAIATLSTTLADLAREIATALSPESRVEIGR